MNINEFREKYNGLINEANSANRWNTESKN